MAPARSPLRWGIRGSISRSTRRASSIAAIATAASFSPMVLPTALAPRPEAAYIPAMTSTADPRRFLYRDNALDPAAARRLTAQALAGCDDGELYLQYLASESFGFDDGRLKTADFNTQAGFGLRGVAGETTAFARSEERRVGKEAT